MVHKLCSNIVRLDVDRECLHRLVDGNYNRFVVHSGVKPVDTIIYVNIMASILQILFNYVRKVNR